MKALRSDNGGEYIFDEFKDFCKAEGIQRELIAPITHSRTGLLSGRTEQRHTIPSAEDRGSSEEPLSVACRWLCSNGMQGKRIGELG